MKILLFFIWYSWLVPTIYVFFSLYLLINTWNSKNDPHSVSWYRSQMIEYKHIHLFEWIIWEWQQWQQHNDFPIYAQKAFTMIFIILKIKFVFLSTFPLVFLGWTKLMDNAIAFWLAEGKLNQSEHSNTEFSLLNWHSISVSFQATHFDSHDSISVMSYRKKKHAA